MSRFLRRAALAASRAMGHASNPRPFSGLFLASSFPSSAGGHLGLVRARPALRDLNALLTPEAFLLDATNTLGAAALRVLPAGAGARHARDVFGPKKIAEAEAQGDACHADALRMFIALDDVEDGRFQDALNALARLAAEGCGARCSSRLCAAAVCYMLGRADEADQWLAGIPEQIRPAVPGDDLFFRYTLVAATVGGAPGAVAGSEGQMAAAAFQIIDEKLWQSVLDGDMSIVSKLLITGLLKRVVKAEHKDVVSIFRVLKEARHSRHPLAYASTHIALMASQALLSAVVLHAQPLSGECVGAALRVAGRDLGRAVEEGDAAAVADLRLVLALLAARDGRFDEALERYTEAARDDPSDPRPQYLAHILCMLLGRMEESDKWEASYESLNPGSLELEEQVTLCNLKDELVIAQALGAPTVFGEHIPATTRIAMRAAASRVDAALVSALRDKKMSVAGRLKARAVRAFLHAGVWSKLKELKGNYGVSATATD
ncbi:hypothetical protein ACP70R_041040 [Stipagrostis hirtigluma subsp. patula]